MKGTFAALLGATLLAGAAQAAAPADAPMAPDLVAFRSLYKELVETNTTLSSGSCTLAAERMAARLRAAGMPGDRVIPYADPAHPREGGLVAILPGSAKTLKPILLIAHLDVVEARREDWTRDPFTLVEENGFFYARGAADDKAMAAVWVDMFARFAKSGYRPKRTIKLALSCGEETNGAFNGIEWLAKNRRDLIDAEFALNEGGGGESDGHDKVLSQGVQVGEKTFANYELETRNPGGHSSIPVRDNAIYQLSHALVKLQDYEFPLEMTEVTRASFAAGASRHDALGDAMVALAKNPQDKAAEAIVNTNRGLHSNLRTTCVATMVDAGHARNALPQRARANVNCRIFPGHSIEAIRDELMKVVADPGVSITILPPKRPSPPAPPLDPKVIGPMRTLVSRYFPGVPLVPAMANGYTDATFLGAVGIPTYGAPGMWFSPDGDGAHGLNERISVKSLYTGRAFLTDLVKAYAG